jgi:hypothetical protein
MDTDGNPEVLDLLYIEIVDEINSAAVICFEFNGKKCQ